MLFKILEAPRGRAFAMALLAALLFGASTPAEKILLASLPALQIAGLLGVGSALVALPFLRRNGGLQCPWRLERRTRNRLFVSLGFGGTLSPVLLLLGLQLAAAGSVSMWLNLELVFTVTMAALFFGEHLSGRGWLAVAAAVLAAGSLTIGHGSAGFVASALIAGACLCWALDNNATATIDGISPAQTVFWKGLTSAAVNLSLALLFTQKLPALAPAAAGIGIGVVSYGASIMLYIAASQNLGATRTQTVFASAPFFGVALSWLVLGETISALQIAAGLVLAGAIVVLFRSSHNHEHVHERVEHLHTHTHVDGHHDVGPEHGHAAVPAGTRHSHVHRHKEQRHAHDHVPDLHHRHKH